LGFNDLSVEHKAHGVGGLGHMRGRGKGKE